VRLVIIANSLPEILQVLRLREHRGNWLARRRGARGEGFAQHRITGRHVIGRRPSRLVGTDELREKEPRGGGEEPVRKRGLRGCGEDERRGGREGEDWVERGG